LWNDIIDINNGNPTSHPIFDQVSRVRFSRLGRFLDEKSAALGHRLSEENTDLFRRINQLTEWSGEAKARLDLDEDTIVIIDGTTTAAYSFMRRGYCGSALRSQGRRRRAGTRVRRPRT